LQSGRGPVPQNQAEKLAVELKFANAQQRDPAGCVNKTNDHSSRLRYNGGYRYAKHAKVENDHETEIERDIQYCGKNQEI
jgi:hypothetical protein